MNEAFARAVVDTAAEGAAVLVQDYHLTLLGPTVAAHRPDLSLVHFHHTPFAGPDTLRVLPPGARDEMLVALSSLHACGFHTRDWASNFRADVERWVGDDPAATVFESSLSTDPDDIRATAASSACQEQFEAIERRLEGRQLIVRVDRMELSKNIVRGFLAFDLLLARRPDLRGRVVFLACCYPSRENVPAYARYRDEVEAAARSVNERWGTDDWTPDRARDRRRLPAFGRRAAPLRRAARQPDPRRPEPGRQGGSAGQRARRPRRAVDRGGCVVGVGAGRAGRRAVRPVRHRRRTGRSARPAGSGERGSAPRSCADWSNDAPPPIGSRTSSPRQDDRRRGAEVDDDAVSTYGSDIYTEPDVDPDTLANLGPLAPLAGIWEGTSGSDAHPESYGTGRDVFVERYEAQPIDGQTNGPQLFYGLRYHTHIVKPGEVETFHDQVGYWLWEPATETVVMALSIPRGQALLAGGSVAADATEFELHAAIGSETYGIVSNPFLDRAFRTTSYRIHVQAHADGTWSYEEEGIMEIPGRDEPFRHIDGNTLHRIAAPTPNPLALAAPMAETSDGAVDDPSDGSLAIGSLRGLPQRGSIPQ